MIVNLSPRMKLKMACLALGVFLHGSVFAETTITVPEELVVVSINNQNIKSGLFKSQKDYKVDSGQVQLNLRYQQYFELHNARHEIVKSGIISVHTPELKDNQRYRLTLVNPPQDVDEAKKFANDPIIAVYDQNNTLVSQQSALNVATKPSIGAGLFTKSIDLTNKQPLVQEDVQIVNVSNQIQFKSAQQNTTTSTLKAVDQQLIQLWQRASKTERQSFMSWLADQ